MTEDLDRGYMEDREDERDVEEGRVPLPETGDDPLEQDRQAQNRPQQLAKDDAQELSELSPVQRGELRPESEDVPPG